MKHCIHLYKLYKINKAGPYEDPSNTSSQGNTGKQRTVLWALGDLPLIFCHVVFLDCTIGPSQASTRMFGNHRELAV